MPTATEIITEAMGHLGILGAGETLGADDAETCRTILNTMIDGWNLPSLTQYTTTDGTATLSGGSTSLTIGPSMNINVTRPVRIELGSWVRSGSIDYPMDQIDEAEYNSISLKSIQGFVPRVFFYDPGASTGTIYYHPAPSGSVVVHHPLASQFTAFADLTTNYIFPQGYKRMMVFNLAVEASSHFEQPVTPFVGAQAAATMRLVKRANNRVPQLDTGASRGVGVIEGFQSGWTV